MRAEEPPKEAVVEVKAASLDEGDKAKLHAEKSGGDGPRSRMSRIDAAEADRRPTESEDEADADPEPEPERPSRAESTRAAPP